jgi:hypothetical protein
VLRQQASSHQLQNFSPIRHPVLLHSCQLACTFGDPDTTQLYPAASKAMQTKCLALHPVMSTDDAQILCAETLLHCATDMLSLSTLVQCIVT